MWTGLKLERAAHWTRLLGLWFKRRTLFEQFALAASLVLGVTMISVGSWISSRIEEGVLRSSAEAGAAYMASFLEPHIQALASGGPLPPESLAKLDEISSNLDLRGHVLSVKVWLPNGTIAYSRQSDLIGRQFDPAEFEPALRGEVQGHLNALDEEENAFERTLAASLYEIYAPLYKTGTREVIAVGEFYENAERLDAELFEAALDNWLVVGGSAVGMLLLLFVIVHRGSATIDQQKAALQLKLREQAKLHRTNERLREKMHAAMREASRIDDMIQKRLGAELHDGPAQLLTFVLLRLEEIDELLKAVPGPQSISHTVVEEVQSAASEALNELRSISTGLFLPNLEETDLVGLLQSIVRGHERRTGSHVAFEATGIPDPLPKDVIRCIGRVTQEALTNAYKHAGGAGQEVSLSVKGSLLLLFIRDSGPGIGISGSRDTPTTERLGVLGMKYRVESLGGSMELRSRYLQGTEVSCQIPLTYGIGHPE